MRQLFCLSTALCFTLLLAIPLHAFSRIVSLKPNVTEIVFALGAGPQVVGVTQFCKQPPEAQALPKIADYVHLFSEAILKLQPDLILGSKENSIQKEINFLKARKIRVELLDFQTIEQTLGSIEKLGVLLGKEKAAQAIMQKMKKSLQDLSAKSKGLPQKRVLFVVDYHPLVIAGGNNFFDEAAHYVGAVNVAGTSRLAYPYYSTEMLLRSQPEIILDFAMGSTQSQSTWQERLTWWQQFSSIPAVKNGSIYPIDINTMRAAPILTNTLWKIFYLLHPQFTPGARTTVAPETVHHRRGSSGRRSNRPVPSIATSRHRQFLCHRSRDHAASSLRWLF